ncbi:hypothetical protein CBR_g25962 [Chara braunii]|uniref:Zeta toxin domain-containing protein n=1 Tax=Chara braunii TaxID=69332 RepID=A0A388L6V2_CHABU|nr:hypothetical protein CBR_g25962 [Chara braunii]|eukprot:GBG78027.1 hypothetical protein CBR_g25962 [Chara braunii]
MTDNDSQRLVYIVVYDEEVGVWKGGGGGQVGNGGRSASGEQLGRHPRGSGEENGGNNSSGIIPDGRGGRRQGVSESRYTRSILASALQLMGCKPRHAHKVSALVFQMLRKRMEAESKRRARTRGLFLRGRSASAEVTTKSRLREKDPSGDTSPQPQRRAGALSTESRHLLAPDEAAPGPRADGCDERGVGVWDGIVRSVGKIGRRGGEAYHQQRHRGNSAEGTKAAISSAAWGVDGEIVERGRRMTTATPSPTSITEKEKKANPTAGSMVRIDREAFVDVVCQALNEYHYAAPNTRSDLMLACKIRERKSSVTVLLCGTSGCGKSTLASLLASRLGITTVVSSDSIRHMMRSFVSEKDNPLLWASTYHAGEFIDMDAVEAVKAPSSGRKADPEESAGSGAGSKGEMQRTGTPLPLASSCAGYAWGSRAPVRDGEMDVGIWTEAGAAAGLNGRSSEVPGNKQCLLQKEPVEGGGDVTVDDPSAASSHPPPRYRPSATEEEKDQRWHPGDSGGVNVVHGTGRIDDPTDEKSLEEDAVDRRLRRCVSGDGDWGVVGGKNDGEEDENKQGVQCTTTQNGRGSRCMMRSGISDSGASIGAERGGSLSLPTGGDVPPTSSSSSSLVGQQCGSSGGGGGGGYCGLAAGPADGATATFTSATMCGGGGSVGDFASGADKKRTIKGYKAQSEMVIDSLDRLIGTYEKRKESVVVEGVHLSLNFVMGLMKSHPSVIPFLVYISNESKHLERFAVRAKYMTLEPSRNKYVKYIRNIRTIQDYLCKRADKHLVPKVDNTNVDKSLAVIHATVFGCLRRRESGESLLDVATNTVRPVYLEYQSQYPSATVSSKGMFQLIQRKGSQKDLMALIASDGRMAGPWPVPPGTTVQTLLESGGGGGGGGVDQVGGGRATDATVPPNPNADLNVNGDAGIGTGSQMEEYGMTGGRAQVQQGQGEEQQRGRKSAERSSPAEGGGGDGAGTGDRSPRVLWSPVHLRFGGYGIAGWGSDVGGSNYSSGGESGGSSGGRLGGGGWSSRGPISTVHGAVGGVAGFQDYDLWSTSRASTSGSSSPLRGDEAMELTAAAEAAVGGGSPCRGGYYEIQDALGYYADGGQQEGMIGETVDPSSEEVEEDVGQEVGEGWEDSDAGARTKEEEGAEVGSVNESSGGSDEEQPPQQLKEAAGGMGLRWSGSRGGSVESNGREEMSEGSSGWAEDDERSESEEEYAGRVGNSKGDTASEDRWRAGGWKNSQRSKVTTAAAF